LATKWKNNLYIIVTILLFTFGANGILSGISLSHQYLEFDYAKTEQFSRHLNEFTQLLDIFELNYISQDQMKEKIIVTAELRLPFLCITPRCH
jgi:hypothetical protein